ncbi:hypothetical protein GIB67_007160 [Kingdonia uniflora]|uniref:Uncharacterized protein n=1 Tax=Kingdonia uniflora TaxID=39325 RepID=A0A7J7MLF5_9MAGN|nr:hypothetical protein GIB67_007160 [Kingdonia uniflora]
MITNGDNSQEFKPILNVMSHSARPLGSAAANVSILNNLSQARQVMSSASLTEGTSSMGLQTINGIPMAMHMSNMISNGAAQNSFSSSQSGITSLVRTSQNAQNAVLGSFSTQASNISGNSNHGMSPPLVNVQAAVTTGQSVPAISQGNLSGTQIGMNMTKYHERLVRNLVWSRHDDAYPRNLSTSSSRNAGGLSGQRQGLPVLSLKLKYVFS